MLQQHDAPRRQACVPCGIVRNRIPHTASLTHTASSPSAGAFAFAERDVAQRDLGASVSPGDTTRTAVGRREQTCVLGLGMVPREAADACPMRAYVFRTGAAGDCKWHWEVVSIHTHALSLDDVRRVVGVELAERARVFVAETDGRAPASALLARLVAEGRSASPAAVNMAVSRASKGSAGSELEVVPCSLSVLRLIASDVIGELIASVHLPGSHPLIVERTCRPPDDNSRGALAACWHKEEVIANCMTTARGAHFAVITCRYGLSLLGKALVLAYDSSYGYGESSRASMGTLVVFDKETTLSVPAAILVLGDQTAPTLVAALAKLRDVAVSAGSPVTAKVFLQDNAFKDWAAFCFVFGSLLWHKLCLVRVRIPRVRIPFQ